MDDPLTVVNELVQEVMTALDCQAFFNFAADEGAGKLRLNAYSGISAEEAGNIQWLDYGVAVRGCVVRDGVPIIVGDIPSNPELKTDLIRSYSLQAYDSHPLTVRQLTTNNLPGRGVLSFRHGFGRNPAPRKNGIPA